MKTKKWVHPTTSQNTIRYRLFVCPLCKGKGSALLYEVKEEDKKK